MTNNLTRRPSGWTFICLSLAVSAIFLASNYSFLFRQPHMEASDFAANALEIFKAKHFQSIHGNYSRFGFHHPGPAFFYCYALGEWILHDLLHLVPSPFNAHIISGIILQASFFAWALVILQRRGAHPLLLPILSLLAAIHFGWVNYRLPDNAFISIWPPHVLLFPFVLFLVASASTASGSVSDILPAAISGCFLVHGHVAQPLFVLPLFLLAIGAWVAGLRADGRSFIPSIKENRRRLGGAALIVLLFSWPIMLDATKGAQSNLGDILRHLSAHSGDHKTLAQSLIYFATFFCYVADPRPCCDAITSHAGAFLAASGGFALGWAAIIVALIICLPRLLRTNPFARWLLIYALLGTILTIIWGTLQNGPMYNFNSFFNFGLLFVFLALFALAGCLRVAVKRSQRFALIYLAVIPLAFGAAHSWRSGHVIGENVLIKADFSQLPAAAKENPNPRKFLTFPHDEWPYAVGVALQLKRLGANFSVAEEWGFMFGPEHVVDPLSSIMADHPPIWRVGSHGPAKHGFAIPGGPFVATAPLPIDPRTGIIRFNGSEANAVDYAISGWAFSDEPFAWSVGKTALLVFAPLPSSTDVEIQIDLQPRIFPGVPSQRVVISVPGMAPQTFTRSAAAPILFTVERAVWNASDYAAIRFDFPDAVSALSMHVSDDPRVLGFEFVSIRFQEPQTAGKP